MRPVEGVVSNDVRARGRLPPMNGEKMNYSNTNEHLYDDIALWEKTDGRDLFLGMPLTEKNAPSVLDFGYGFGENLFALSNAYPNGKIYGID